jgi:hypothetical protein
MAELFFVASSGLKLDEQFANHLLAQGQIIGKRRVGSGERRAHSLDTRERDY